MKWNENQLLICGSVHTLLAFLSSSSDSRPWHHRDPHHPPTETCRAACVCPTNPQTHSSRSHSQHLQKPVALVPSVTFYNHRQISDPRASPARGSSCEGFKQRRYRPVYKSLILSRFTETMWWIKSPWRHRGRKHNHGCSVKGLTESLSFGVSTALSTSSS